MARRNIMITSASHHLLRPLDLILRALIARWNGDALLAGLASMRAIQACKCTNPSMEIPLQSWMRTQGQVAMSAMLYSSARYSWCAR